MVSNIGLKIANGEFYPILEENSAVKKRLVLTTVHNNQRSVQIDLYKSYTRTMVDALYIGSLIMENIKPRPKGEPSIELVISSTSGGEIIAEAVDMDTSVRGEHQTLNVSLRSLEGESLDAEIPDFALEQNEPPPPTGLLGKAGKAKEKEKKSFPWLIVIIVAALLVAIGAVVLFFVSRDNGGTGRTPSAVQAPAPTPPPAAPAPQQPAPTPPPPAPPAQAPAAVQAQPPAPPPAVQAPPPVIQAPAAPPPVTDPAARRRPPPPVASFNVPAVIPRGGVPYRIRYGDTLWDIAEAFYRDPFLYPRIARFNNIRNPDFIISGTLIHVPPRN